jgi:hypothetical protein
MMEIIKEGKKKYGPFVATETKYWEKYGIKRFLVQEEVFTVTTTTTTTTSATTTMTTTGIPTKMIDLSPMDDPFFSETPELAGDYLNKELYATKRENKCNEDDDGLRGLPPSPDLSPKRKRMRGRSQTVDGSQTNADRRSFIESLREEEDDPRLLVRQGIKRKDAFGKVPSPRIDVLESPLASDRLTFRQLSHPHHLSAPPVPPKLRKGANPVEKDKKRFSMSSPLRLRANGHKRDPSWLSSEETQQQQQPSSSSFLVQLQDEVQQRKHQRRSEGSGEGSGSDDGNKKQQHHYALSHSRKKTERRKTLHAGGRKTTVITDKKSSSSTASGGDSGSAMPDSIKGGEGEKKKKKESRLSRAWRNSIHLVPISGGGAEGEGAESGGKTQSNEEKG